MAQTIPPDDRYARLDEGCEMGTATILLGTKSIAVTLAGLGGNAAVACLGFIDATLLSVLSCVWSGDVLTITGDVNATADTIVHYMVQKNAGTP